MYGLSFSSENAPNEYYYEDEIFEENNWKYAFLVMYKIYL